MIAWFKRGIRLWKHDRNVGRLFHVWLYLFVVACNTNDRVPFDLVDGVLTKQMELRNTL